MNPWVRPAAGVVDDGRVIVQRPSPMTNTMSSTSTTKLPGYLHRNRFRPNSTGVEWAAVDVKSIRPAFAFRHRDRVVCAADDAVEFVVVVVAAADDEPNLGVDWRPSV